MFILDTNVLSELRPNKPRQSTAVRDWAQRQSAHHIYLSAVTLMELEIGIQRMERRDPQQGRHLRVWAESTLGRFEGRILPFTPATALLCANLHVPNPRPLGDSMIAATALEHRFAVVTRNVADFAGAGVETINPWDWP